MVKSSDASEDLLPKQIGCMNTIFQLFDRRLLYKRLLAVAGAQQQLEPHSATKAVIEKDPELQPSESSKSTSYASLSHPSTHSPTRGLHCPDIRDVVKDAMYREARSMPIKSFAIDGRVTVMKHLDSPRLRVALPRFSYDGRETRETLRENMKLKELPRFSLDSKASSMKQQGCDLDMENENPMESGGHSRSSSIVAKLMGLEDFADSITTDKSSVTRTNPSSSPRVALLSKTQAREVSSPQSVVRKNPVSQSPRQHKNTPVGKTTIHSKLPLEPAPWKKQDCRKKTAVQSGRNPSSSVYGEMEKRISQLEFKKSGKDLRALKQILEAMQKTRQKLENQRRESDSISDESSSNQNSSSSMLQNEKPVLIAKETCCPRQLSSSTKITKSTKVKGKVRTQERANYLTPVNSNKKISKRNLESEHSAPQGKKVENCTNTSRVRGMQHIVQKNERGSHPTAESSQDRKQSRKKVRETCHENGKDRVKLMDLQLSNDQSTSLSNEKQYSSYLGDTASAKSESSTSAASHVEIAAALSSASLFSLNSRKQDYVTTPKQHIPAAELAVIMMEQPSPVSVLETPFYIEGSPSPVKKISTAFKEDESSSHDEAEWAIQNPHHLAACTDSCYRNNQKSENLLDLVHQSRSFKTKPNETAATNNETAYQSFNSVHGYNNKMCIEFSLHNETSITQKDKESQHVSFVDIFDSNMFQALQGEDGLISAANEELIKNNDHMKFNQKIQRELVADMANEILVRKITSGRLFTMARGRMSLLQGLIKEVYLETEHLCSMPYCDVDDEDDRLIRILNVDMKYQSDDWADYNGEVPALVLDIERLIFKDPSSHLLHHDHHQTKEKFGHGTHFEGLSRGKRFL